MGLLAQCGYGRGQKVDRGIADNIICGAVMSPRDEPRIRICDCVRRWKNDPQMHSAVIIFDPQFYVSSLPNPRDNYLSEHTYYSDNMGLRRTDFTHKRIERIVRDCLQYQHKENFTYIVAPVIAMDSFRDYWSQIAVEFFSSSVAIHNEMPSAPPLFLSIVVSEDAMLSTDAVTDYLDAITSFEVKGFYIVLKRNSISLQSTINPTVLSNFMYFCYVLSVVNEYNVIVGYCDWISFLLESIGVTFTANGWHQNTRQFSNARFTPSTGGRRPRKRYSSLPLLSNALIVPEMENIYDIGRLNEILSHSPFDSIIQNLNATPAANEPMWADEISCLAHWHSLKTLADKVKSSHSANEPSSAKLRLIQSRKLIGNAITLYNSLLQNGVSFEPSTGPDHLNSWMEAIRLFWHMVDIDG